MTQSIPQLGNRNKEGQNQCPSLSVFAYREDTYVSPENIWHATSTCSYYLHAPDGELRYSEEELKRKSFTRPDQTRFSLVKMYKCGGRTMPSGKELFRELVTSLQRASAKCIWLWVLR